MKADRPLRLLALSGSLRAASTNTALLRAAQALSPPEVDIRLFEQIGQLPHFNPDLDGPGVDLPPVVADFRQEVGRSDGLLVACPEYAHGVPGAFKNALDWLVGGPEFPGKPVALLQASTRGMHARSSLTEILRTMSGIVLDEVAVGLPLLGKTISAGMLAEDPVSAETIRIGVRNVASAVRLLVKAREAEKDSYSAHCPSG